MAKKKYKEDELLGSASQPSILGKTLQAGLSGISAVGNLLDVPGSMVRDVIGGVSTGDWRKHNPVDQLLTPFREGNRTSGRDLNRMGGLAGSNDTYGNWWGGLGTEIATDPLTYLTLGSSAIGKGIGRQAAKAGIHGLEAARIATAARKAGKLPGAFTNSASWVGPREARLTLTGDLIKKFAPEMFGRLQSTSKATGFDLTNNMQEPLGALAKLWPLGDSGLIGTGKTAQKIARGLDVAGNAIRHTRIPGTAIRPVGDLANLVNAKAMKAVTPEDLQTAYHASHVKEGARYETNLLGAKWTNDLIRMGHKDTDAMTVRNWIEFRDLPPSQGGPPPEAKDLVGEIGRFMDRIPAMAKELGVKINDLNPRLQAAGSDAKYFMRQMAEGLTGGRGSFGKAFDPGATAELARAPWSLGSRGGTKAIAEMFKDPVLETLIGKGRDVDSLARWIKRRHGKNLPAEFLDQEQMSILEDMGRSPSVAQALAVAQNNPALASKLKPQNTYKAAAKSMLEMSPEVRKAGVYANHPINDFVASATGTMDKLASSKVALERLTEAVVPSGPGTVPLKTVLNGLDLDLGDGATYGAARWLAQKGVGVDAHVNPETAKFLTQMHEGFKGGPESTHAMVKLYDDIANFTKLVFTNLDPIRFNVRNVVSGQVSNALQPEQFSLKSVADANNLIRGGVIQGASQNPFIAEEWARRSAGQPGSQRIVKRTEQVGDLVADFKKPHGVYTSPGDVNSPHAELGGSQSEWVVNPSAKILKIQPPSMYDSEIGIRKLSGGTTINTSGAGIWALREFAGPEIFNKMKKWTTEEARSQAYAAFPDYDWSKYVDTQEILEGYAGAVARAKGYDAIDLIHPKNPEWSEFVGLTENSMKQYAKQAPQPLDDKRATEILSEMLYAREATGSYGVSALPQHGQTNLGGRLQDVIHGIPGGEPFRFGQAKEKLKGGLGKSGTTWNPFTSYRGVGGAEKTRFAPAAAGEDISHWAESMNRIAPMWALMQAGVHPDEAIERVLKAQVGYQGRFYTKTEQQVLKRLMLFYSFSKGMFPFTLQQLLENPGGRLAQSLRAINRSKSQDELVPQHVAETASIPVPELPGMAPLEKGAKRYITGMGLGFEDPLQFAVPSFQNAGLEAMSRMNPLLKGPLEAVTGQSFFQRGPGGGGRSLEDLDPPLGRIMSNIGQMAGSESKAPVRFPGSGTIEHMLANSPLSNLMTKARTITDPRKGVGAKAVNLLTGVKATDVSPAAQDRELRNRIGQVEKSMGGRVYSDTYLPKDVQASMSKEELAAYKQLQALRNLLEERSKARRK